jgi:hypothetical protein
VVFRPIKQILLKKRDEENLSESNLPEINEYVIWKNIIQKIKNIKENLSNGKLLKYITNNIYKKVTYNTKV